jgi:hypothetical protein
MTQHAVADIAETDESIVGKKPEYLPAGNQQSSRSHEKKEQNKTPTLRALVHGT